MVKYEVPEQDADLWSCGVVIDPGDRARFPFRPPPEGWRFRGLCANGCGEPIYAAPHSLQRFCGNTCRDASYKKSGALARSRRQAKANAKARRERRAERKLAAMGPVKN